MDAIKTVKLTKKYKDLTAVNALDLTVKQGELFSLLGVNGAGKTTTVKMLTCLTAPDGGDAFVCGKSICTDANSVKAHIALSPQETAVAPKLSVRENLRLMCGVYGYDKGKTAEKATFLAEKFGLTAILDKKAEKLSGGTQRRLSIAMALAGEPRVLFLDEPTLGLDVLARNELHETILALKGKLTTVLTTHYMEEAEALSDRVGIMKDGALLAVGTVPELKAMTQTDSLEKAFIAIVKGASK